MAEETPLVRTCGAMITHNLLLETSAQYRENIARLERVTEERLFENFSGRKSKVNTIPIIVHVVWNKSDENISDAQIFSQIDVLNEDFNAQNHDRLDTPDVWKDLISSFDVTFTLEKITRTQTTVREFSAEKENVKSTQTGGQDPWDTDRYLNSVK